MNRRWLVVFSVIAMLGCDRGKSQSGGPPKIGYTIHVLNDFTVVIKRGAENAGKDLGAEVNVQGPPNLDVPAAIARFEAMANGKPDGLVTMPMQGTMWRTPIDRVSKTGIPILTANVTLRGAQPGPWFGQDEYNSGVVLARELKKQLTMYGKINGTVVVGVCAPGVDVLTQRYNGFREGMQSSGFTITEPFDVKADRKANYASWEGLANSQKDVVAMVGLCSMDLPNLAELKKRSGGTWVAVGYDLNVETLDAIKAGSVQVTLGQHPYLQGYLPVRALVEHAKDKKALPVGWIDVGTEVVTKENVESVYPRETDRDAEAKWYAEHIAKNFADLAAVAKPMPAGR